MNNSIEFVECINPMSINCDIIECLFIEIICKLNKNIIMGVTYHPPDNDADNFTTELDKLITSLTCAKNKNIFLAGGFNINLSILISTNLLNTF